MSKEVQEAKEPKIDNGLAKFNTEFRALAEIMRIVQQDTLLIDPDYYIEHGYPREAWRWLRRNDRVRFIERPSGSSYWAIPRHEDITAIGKDPVRFLNEPLIVLESEDRKEGQGFSAPQTLIQMDPPKHNALRQLVDPLSVGPRALEARR